MKHWRSPCHVKGTQTVTAERVKRPLRFRRHHLGNLKESLQGSKVFPYGSAGECAVKPATKRNQVCYSVLRLLSCQIHFSCRCQLLSLFGLSCVFVPIPASTWKAFNVASRLFGERSFWLHSFTVKGHRVKLESRPLVCVLGKERCKGCKKSNCTQVTCVHTVPDWYHLNKEGQQEKKTVLWTFERWQSFRRKFCDNEKWWQSFLSEHLYIIDLPVLDQHCNTNWISSARVLTQQFGSATKFSSRPNRATYVHWKDKEGLPRSKLHAAAVFVEMLLSLSVCRSKNKCQNRTVW